MKYFKWDKKYLYWGVTAFCVIVASIAFFWVLNRWSGVVGLLRLMTSALAPILYGILIAYLLNKVLVIFEAHLFRPLASKIFPARPVVARKAARIFSILVTLLLALGIIAGLLVIILPQIYRSVVDLVTESQRYVDIAVNWLRNILDGDLLEPVAVQWLNTISGQLVSWLDTNVLPQISALISNITGGVISFVMVVVNLLIGVVISVYVMYNKETFCAQAKKVTFSVFKVKTADRIIEEMGFINDAFGNYIVGTIIDSVIVGVLNYIFMAIMDMPYTALVSIIIAVTNLIPVFGPFIGAIPSALLILLESPMQCLIFVVFTVVLQQADAHILKPRIHSSRTGLSGFWIMFAILFFGGLFGITGMVIGVPLTTVLYSILRRLNNRRLRSRGLPEDTGFYRRIDRIDAATGEPIYKPGMAPQTPDDEPIPAEEAAHEDPGD